jgi:hypothetical protein
VGEDTRSSRHTGEAWSINSDLEAVKYMRSISQLTPTKLSLFVNYILHQYGM